MSVLSIKKPEATYTLDLTGHLHFAIGCVCSGKSSHFKNVGKTLESYTDSYIPPKARRKHTYTFYTSKRLFEMELEDREVGKQGPLVVMCDDCGREFPFTLDSYLNLCKEIKESNS